MYIEILACQAALKMAEDMYEKIAGGEILTMNQTPSAV